MSSKRFFFVMIGLIVTLLAATGFAAFQGDALLRNESSKLVDLKLANLVLEKQEQDLQQAERDIEEYEDLETITKSIVPQEKDQANTIAEIATLANQSGIRLGSIEFPASELGEVVKKGKAAKAPNTTQLEPLSDLKGVYVMQITVLSHRDSPVLYDQIITFLEGLEKNRRTAQVTDISITPSREVPGRFSFTLTLNTYIRPE